MADLLLMPKEKKTAARIEQIGRLRDLEDQLLSAPVRDIKAITALAIEMRELGLKKASRALLDKIGA